MGSDILMTKYKASFTKTPLNEMLTKTQPSMFMPCSFHKAIAKKD